MSDPAISALIGAYGYSDGNITEWLLEEEQTVTTGS
jgi:hypothetical protein